MNPFFFLHSLTVIKITLLERSLNITRLLQATLSHTNVFFKTNIYAVAMVIIKQAVCIATTFIMWKMWILPEKRSFSKKKSTNLYIKLNVYFCSKNPMYEPFLCGCYGNLSRICIATTNELFEKHTFVLKRDVQYRNI